MGGSRELGESGGEEDREDPERSARVRLDRRAVQESR